MKRIGRQFVICVVLGFVTSVTIAFGLAYRASHIIGNYLNPGSAGIGLPPYDEFTTLYIVQYDRQTLGSGLRRIGYSHLFESTSDHIDWAHLVGNADDSPWWARPVGGELEFRMQAVAGWPVYCLTGFMTDNHPHENVVISGLIIPTGQSAGAPPIPWHPLWRGMFVNTLFYGSAWWVLLFAPGYCVRWRRKRRVGRCSNCDYDLRGNPTDVCPECGTGNKSAKEPGRRPSREAAVDSH